MVYNYPKIMEMYGIKPPVKQKYKIMITQESIPEAKGIEGLVNLITVIEIEKVKPKEKNPYKFWIGENIYKNDKSKTK